MNQFAKVSLVVVLIAVAATLLFFARTRTPDSQSRQAAALGEEESASQSDNSDSSNAVEPRSNSSSAARSTYRVMTPETEGRLELIATDLAKSNPAFKDYFERMRNEDEDPAWSAPVEGNLQALMAKNGGKLTGLEISQPDCKSSVCAITAAGGTNSGARDADFQSLLGSMFAQESFRNTFKDQFTTVKLDGNRVVYITYFDRK